MSQFVYFSFSTGLDKPILVPQGTLAGIRDHVQHVELALKLETEQYEDNPPHWTMASTQLSGVDDKTACREVAAHNDWVRWVYETFAQSKDRKRGKDSETITPKQAATFWHALEFLDVPPERWTRDYYRERMEVLYGVMRGRPQEGTTFDAKPLTPEQADAVICLFSEYLDRHDIRLAVPWRCDRLASSYNGEYVWCSHCGLAIATDDVRVCQQDDTEKCPKCRKELD